MLTLREKVAAIQRERCTSLHAAALVAGCALLSLFVVHRLEAADVHRLEVQLHLAEEKLHVSEQRVVSVTETFSAARNHSSRKQARLRHLLDDLQVANASLSQWAMRAKMHLRTANQQQHHLAAKLSALKERVSRLTAERDALTARITQMAAENKQNKQARVKMLRQKLEELFAVLTREQEADGDGDKAAANMGTSAHVKTTACPAGVACDCAFDLARCDGREFGVYVYEDEPYVDLHDYGHYIFRTLLDRSLLRAMLVDDPVKACLFILPLSYRMVVRNSGMDLNLSRLPYWNGGRNHLVWDPWDFDKGLRTRRQIGHALLATSSGAYTESSIVQKTNMRMRRGCDISIPLWAQSVYTFLTPVSATRRRYLARQGLTHSARSTLNAGSCISTKASCAPCMRAAGTSRRSAARSVATPTCGQRTNAA